MLLVYGAGASSGPITVADTKGAGPGSTGITLASRKKAGKAAQRPALVLSRRGRLTYGPALLCVL